jgi:hypothetical protein
MTTLSRTAYSTEKRDMIGLLDEVKKYRYHLYQIDHLNRNDWDHQRESPAYTAREGNMLLLTFVEAFIRDGELFVKTKGIRTRNQELEIIRADEKSITLMERDGKRISNYYLLSEKDVRVQKGIELIEYRKGKEKIIGQK